MLISYLKLTLRIFKRQPLYGVISVVGLAVGMACCILIGLFLQHEFSYDSFHKNAKQIYRIQEISKEANGTEIQAITPLPMPYAVRNEFGQQIEVASFWQVIHEKVAVTVGNKNYFNLIGYSTESKAFQIFDFELLVGNPEGIFDQPNAAVLTLHCAQRLFGAENPFGKFISFRGFQFMVTGIIKDLPSNSIFKFDILISDHIRKKAFPDIEKRWGHGGMYTFVMLPQNISATQFEEQLSIIQEKYLPDYMIRRTEFFIQPLTELHFNDDIEHPMTPTISSAYLYILTVIVFAILLIASINFINLTLSQADRRSKEIGIRKISGSPLRQIHIQFVIEAIIISLIALVFACVLAEIFYPWFNGLVGKDIPLNFSRGFILLLFGFGIIMGILTGMYPGMFMARYKPTKIFHPKAESGAKSLLFRKSLIGMQFIIAIALFICMIIVVKQINFMKHHDLGFNEKNLVAIPVRALSENFDKRLPQAKLFITEAREYSSYYHFSEAAISENIPGYYFQNSFNVFPGNSDDEFVMTVTSVDNNFFDVYQIDIIEGKAYTKDNSADDNALLINQAALEKFGWQSGVNKAVSLIDRNNSFNVIGVVKDIHIKSLQNRIEPVVYRYEKNNYPGFITYRIDPEKIPATLAFFEKTWKELFPGVHFDYFFVDDKYLAQYHFEERIAKIIATFSGLSIFLACLGLFGIVSFLIKVRTKEIGIRKVLGASITGVVRLLTKDFTRWIIVANIVAWPVAYFAMNKWLQNFAYRIDINLWSFLLAGLLVLVIAFLTVSWQTIRAATANPVESLRYE